MSVVQNNSVDETSNLQTELEHLKERFKNCIIKKENEYAKLWNDWYKKCEECKFDKISYDKAYNDMQQKIKRLQAQLGDLKGKNNTKIGRPQPRWNTNNERVPSASKSSRSKNKEVEVEEHHRKLLLSRNKKHISSESINVKLATQNIKSKVVYAMCYPNMFMVRRLKVYFVEGLGHNLFSVGKFCDSDLKVAFRRNACFIRNLEGVDLLSRNRTTNLYTINLHEMASASLICLMARGSSTKSWLWHQRLSHLNFDTINDLTKNDLVFGLPKFKYHKEHLCPLCEKEKSKRASHPPKPIPNSRQRLHLLHMDLCGPMRIASINGKRVFNRRTKKITKTMNVSFDELSAMDFEQRTCSVNETVADNVPNTMFDANTFVNPFATPSTTAAESSSSQYVDPSNMHMFYQPYPYEFQWTKDHPLEQVIGEPSQPVLTRNQLRSDGDMCMYALTVSTMEPKNVKEAMTDPAWIESMQEELL
nr:integrase, catalytic region, zinc finger, CCHC-type, peptidase aspartic, catalytic [Tanacetum cinerariifolium]